MQPNLIRCFSLAVAAAAAYPNTAAAELKLGDRAEFFRLSAINSKAAGVRGVDLGQHIGATPKEPRKAVLLSFFATYCEPCKKEMPFLAALDRTYRDSGLLVLSVTIDRDKKEIQKALKLADSKKVAFPVLSDQYNIVAKRWAIKKLPCVYILDSSGKVILAKVGYKGGVLRDLHNAVRAALGEPADGPVPEALASWVQ